MKIFMSHSSRQKLFVKALRNLLPHSINLWIDEREIIVGESLEGSIKKAIELDCDFFILVLDSYSLSSSWVAKEVEWALEKEKILGRVFLLPIVLEEDAWNKMSFDGLRGRKYLSCYDFNDESIASLARNLTSEILEWLARHYSKQASKRDSSLSLLEEADQYASDIAEEIKTVVMPYRENNPLTIHKLSQLLETRDKLDISNVEDLYDLLNRLNQQNLLNGIFYDDEYIYLSQERYSFKSNLYKTLKKKIANKAASLVKSGHIIAIDGGSTTLEMSKILCRRIKARSLNQLKVLTNSLPAANEFLSTLSEMGAGDLEMFCSVYLMGGLGRPVSLTLISEKAMLSQGAIEYSNLSDLFNVTGKADLAFLGTNGVYQQKGFGNHSRFEIGAKKEMVRNSKISCILTDPSKFLVSQEQPFAFFDQGLKVITAYSEEYASAIEDFRALIQNTPTEIVLA